ncbi:type VI secretion system Vgr family protein [Ectothiorhodospira shaposhnikovii]|uniref:type VI secretion system Vgr family protein n=1 Tax=Ectothiorhodospira shaposhnikovii TaxID=1054 RepID=UPI0039A045EF
MSRALPCLPVQARLVIAGRSLPVMSLRGSESLSGVWRVLLEVIGPGVEYPGRLGAPARLEVSDAHGARKVFDGILCACGPVPGLDVTWAAPHRFRVLLRSRLYRLALTRRTRLFSDLSPPDLAERLLAAAGVRLQSERLMHAYPRRAGILQADESDLSLLNRVLARAGIHWHVTSGHGLETLVLVDDPAGLTPAAPTEWTWRGQSGGWSRQPPGVLSVHERIRPVPGCFTVTGRLADGRAYRASALTGRGEGVQDRIGYGLHTVEALDHRARLLAERACCRHRTLALETTVLGPGAGEWGRLGEIPGRSALEGAWLVTAVQHHAIAGDDGRLNYLGRMALAPRDLPWRPPEPRRSWTVPDLLPVEVAGGPGPVAGPRLDGVGCYRVRLEAETDPVSVTPWLDRMTPYAAPPGTTGSAGGWHAPWHPGQRLMLVCLGGDPDGFAVLDGAFPDARHPSPVNGEYPAAHRYQTPGGLTLLMDDHRDAPVLRLHTAGERHWLSLEAGTEGHLLSLVCREGALIIRAGRCLHVRGGGDMNTRIGGGQVEQVRGSVLRQGDGHMQVRSAKGLRASAGGNLSMTARKDLRVRAGRGVRLLAGGDLVLHVAHGGLQWRVAGDLRVMAGRGLRIEPLGTAPIRIRTGGGGITLLPGAGQVLIHGRGVRLSGRKLDLWGTVDTRVSGA